MTRHARPGSRSTADTRHGPLIAGPRWYRARIRVLGPLLGLVPMAVLGLAYWVTTLMGDGRTSGILGLVAGVSAAPGMLAVGAPFADSSEYPSAILASVFLWVLLGFVASRRATRSPVASWRTFGRELFWLAFAVMLGAIVALVVATLTLGDSLLT